MAGCEKEGNSDSMSLVPGVGPKDITMPTLTQEMLQVRCALKKCTLTVLRKPNRSGTQCPFPTVSNSHD